jgi:hypothetical protein
MKVFVAEFVDIRVTSGCLTVLFTRCRMRQKIEGSVSHVLEICVRKLLLDTFSAFV